MNGSIRRTSDASVGLISIKDRVNKMKRKLTPEAKRRMIIGSPRLLSQESYLSPMAQFSPFTSIGTGSNQLLQAGQLSLSPSISYLAPASQVQFSPMAPPNVNAAPLSPSNLLQNQGPFQTNQIVGSTSNSVNLIPVNNVQSVATLASPGVQTILPTNQGIFTSNFQASPMQSPLQSTIQSSPMVQIASVNQSPNVQTIPVIQNAIPVSLVPSSVGSAPPLKITKTQQFESHIVNSPVALASPSISSAPYSQSHGSSLRSNFIRTPIALRSQIQRATSYFSPSLPTRSQTVYTQTQLVPTHTTVYTTTQFSPATRTIVYETDHVPIYAQTATDSGISAKTSSKYGSSIASLAKYGTSFY
uniref:Uncharacterized protein n=2 Tax=Tetranychus urticae TaxID=32264 RepID=T1KAJ7_TETUR